MTRLISMRPAVVACALLLIGTSASFAQPAHKHDRQAPAAGERPDPAAKAQRHADHLRDALQLTPAQEPALRTLMDALMATKSSDDHREDMAEARAEMARMSTPERLDRMQARMAERQQRFATRAAAVKRFYAQLTPPQQKAFDAMHTGHRGMGMMGHGGKGHGGKGHGDHKH